MDLNSFFDWLNNELLAQPSIFFFFGVSVLLTIRTGFIQLRAFPRFLRLIFNGVAQTTNKGRGTISSFHALFTAMGTTIGMGNVVSPSLAIMVGGPGALFWLVFYMFFGSVTKFCEVVFAIETRKELPDGFILGGPIQYLRSVSDFLANWYGYIIVIVVMSWSGAQANTLANIMALEGVPHWIVGALLAIFVVATLSGGARRVGDFASKLVPIMFVLYVTFAMSIILQDTSLLSVVIKQVFHDAFSPAAAAGGFLGSTIFQAMREGTFRGIFITEAGLGTSSIAHSLADTKNPTDQGILAMGSMIADALLSVLSGLLVLLTGVWTVGEFRSTLTYEVFKFNAPGLAQYILLFSVTLFVLTTVMGNSFNGVQSFGILVNDNKRLLRFYVACTVLVIFTGALIPMRLLWNVMDTLLIFAAIPNLIGILMLVYKKPDIIRLK